jgi:hypothetical protein
MKHLSNNGFTLGDALQRKVLAEVIDYIPPETAQFQLGVITASVQVRQLQIASTCLKDLLNRHASGDFGNFGIIDQIALTPLEWQQGILATDDSGKLNKLAILGNHSDILSEYEVAGQQIWIKTEDVNGSMTYTVIMLPSEY